MLDNVGRLCILDDTVRPAIEIGNPDINKKSDVYEVVRVIKGVPLFLEDHYARLKNSLHAMKYELEITKQEMKRQIQKLIKANGKSNCNVKIIIDIESGGQSCLMYISRSYYPGEVEIENGVRVGLFNWERQNPNIKLNDNIYKNTVSSKILNEGVFEVLLVNSGGKITEGSKSNVFFVKGSKVFTAPDDYILKGVTRQYIIYVCEKLGIELFETLISVDLLNDMEGVFLTGTSIKVLPVSEVGGKAFKSSSNTTVTAIRDQYDRLVEEYISKNI